MNISFTKSLYSSLLQRRAKLLGFLALFFHIEWKLLISVGPCCTYHQRIAVYINTKALAPLRLLCSLQAAKQPFLPAWQSKHGSNFICKCRNGDSVKKLWFCSISSCASIFRHTYSAHLTCVKLYTVGSFGRISIVYLLFLSFFFLINELISKLTLYIITDKMFSWC